MIFILLLLLVQVQVLVLVLVLVPVLVLVLFFPPGATSLAEGETVPRTEEEEAPPTQPPRTHPAARPPQHRPPTPTSTPGANRAAVETPQADRTKGASHPSSHAG